MGGNQLHPDQGIEFLHFKEKLHADGAAHGLRYRERYDASGNIFLVGQATDDLRQVLQYSTSGFVEFVAGRGQHHATAMPIEQLRRAQGFQLFHAPAHQRLRYAQHARAGREPARIGDDHEGFEKFGVHWEK